MEIVDKKIVKIKVKNRWRYCLSYSVIMPDGELFTGGLMSVDKKWFFSCCKPAFAHGDWIRVKYYPSNQSYGFPDPQDVKRNPYIICEQVVDAIDSFIVEQMVLGSNPKLK